MGKACQEYALNHCCHDHQVDGFPGLYHRNVLRVYPRERTEAGFHIPGQDYYMHLSITFAETQFSHL